MGFVVDAADVVEPTPIIRHWAMSRPIGAPINVSRAIVDPTEAVSGSLADPARRCVKRMPDFVGVYGGKDETKHSLSDLERSFASCDQVHGITWIAPGRIGDEFCMTRGHILSKPDRSETYAGISETGVLQPESPTGDIRILDMVPGIVACVPPHWIHRSVIAGDRPLAMSFCFPADAYRTTESLSARLA